MSKLYSCDCFAKLPVLTPALFRVASAVAVGGNLLWGCRSQRRVSCCQARNCDSSTCPPQAQRSQDSFDVLKEPRSGVEFLKTVRTWQDDLEPMRLLGVGCRQKKVLLLSVQVYAIAAYVEGEAARREFGIRNRGGFFTGDSGVGEYCDAALDGSCSKLLVLQLLRDVSGETFVSALNEALEARMRIMGESSVLSSFEDFFKDRQLTSGTQVLLLWRTADNTLEVKLLPSSSVEYAAVCSDITQVCADQRFMSAGLCRALFEVYFGGNAVVPEARESFAAGVKNLIEADNVSRGEWKPGGRGTDID